MRIFADNKGGYIQETTIERAKWLGKYFPVRDAELYIESHGRGEPLICLHNFSSNGRARFLSLLPILAENYTCHLVDLRGHGRSTNHSGEWNHELISEDIIRIAEEIGGGSALRFLAVSTGAMAMLRVARYRPDLVKSMVLDSGTYMVPPEARKCYRDPATLSPRLKAYYETANEVYGAEYGPTLAKIFYDFRLAECDINVPIEALEEITAPTLLIAGDRDIFFPVYIPIAMHAAIPNSELYIAENTGHIVMEEHPELVARMAVDFFQRY